MSTPGVTITVNADTQDAAKKLNDFFGNLGGKLVAIAGIAAFAKMAADMAHATQEAIDFADKMGKAAQMIGIQVNQLSALSVAATLADTSTEELGQAVAFLSKQISDATNGSEQAQRTFDDLGLSLQNAKGELKSADEQLAAIADRFKALPDGIQKTTAAQELFGRSGRNMIPLLNGGSEGLRELKAEAAEYGLIIGPRFAANAEHFNDNLNRFKLLAQGVYLQLADFLLPELNRFSDAILNATRSLGLHSGILGTLTDIYKQLAGAIAVAKFGLEALVGTQFQIIGALSANGMDWLNAFSIMSKDLGQDLDGLKKRLEEIQKLGKAPEEIEIVKEGPVSLAALRAQFEEKRRLRDLEIEETKLAQLNISLDQKMNPVEKQRRLNELLNEQIRLIGEKLDLTDAAESRRAITSFDARSFNVKDQGELSQTAAARSPESITDNLTLAARQLVETWGTVAQQIAQTFKDVIGTAITTISNQLTGLILGTKNWGEALKNIGTSVLSALINGIIEMGVKSVLSGGLMKAAITGYHAVATALGWASVSQENAQQAAKTPALATNAALQSAGSWGASATIGIAVLVAAIGTAIAAATGAFEQGGYTGAGISSQPAGIVHQNEFVFSAPAVNRIGLANLEAMHSGQATGGGGGNARTPINFALLNDQSQIPDWLRTRDGEAHIVDIVRKNWYAIA